MTHCNLMPNSHGTPGNVKIKRPAVLESCIEKFLTRESNK
jgi:hypothetical protein